VYSVIRPDLSALEATSIDFPVSVKVEDGVLILRWSPFPNSDVCWIYGAESDPSFVPGIEPNYENKIAKLPPSITFWASKEGIGDLNSNWTYLVTTLVWRRLEIGKSTHIGELDFDCDIMSEFPHD